MAFAGGRNHKRRMTGDNSVSALKAAQAQAKLREALRLHQAGQLEQARQLYEATLKIDPQNPDALHLLGVASAQSGDHQRAIDLIGKAIGVNANNAVYYYNRGAALQKLNRLNEAIASYDKTLALKPDFVDAYNSRGNALQDLKRFEEAIACYDRVVALKPTHAEAHINKGNALLAVRRFSEAVTSYDKALKVQSNYVEAHANRGLALFELRRFEDAVASYDKALALQPDNADGYCDRGHALQQLERFQEAIANYDAALAVAPDHPDAHTNRGNAMAALRRFDEAIASYDKAITLNANNAEAHYNRSNALAALQRLSEAAAGYDRALLLDPDNIEAYLGRGRALHGLKQFDRAVASYDKALARKPESAEAHTDRGLALQELKRFEEAVASYDKALALNPNNAEAHNNRGVALHALRRFDPAIASFDTALALAPDNAEAYSNRGNVMQELRRLDEALACYDQALALTPDNAGLHSNRGVALEKLKRLDEAIASYERALSLISEEADAGKSTAAPEFLLGTYLHTKMQVCDWAGFAENIKKLADSVSNGSKVTPPFAAMTLLDEPDLLLAAATIWTDAKYPNAGAHRQFRNRGPSEKLRIGYYSADFHDHATTHLIAELFEEHDHEKFELYGFSFGPDSDDAMRHRVASAFDRFIDVKSSSDREVAELSIELGIDIAVDLKGFTGDSRLGVFAERCAPIQVNYLGFPGSMGADFIDYIIADRILIPADGHSNFSEKVVYLPPSYQANNSKRRISERVFTRQELGLPEAGFVFCCFNNNYKIFPAMFDAWMRILRAVDASVLWLLEDNPTAAKNLRRAAETRGVDADRLVFAPRMQSDDHLARQRHADLFLDTTPCNAHTTASDALWVGLPVLTLPGKTFAGRVAASLLHALELPDLVASTQDAYVAKAVALAASPQEARALKMRLAQNTMTSPLFKGAVIARHIEAAYEAMYARHQAGLARDHIEIERQP